jgi:hypothetical protein
MLRTTSGVVAALATVLMAWSCSASPASAPSNRACPVADSADTAEITVARAELLLGYSEADAQRCAEELGWAFRVGTRDGEDFPVTLDYSLQRVTVIVIDDVVTAITVG